MDLFDLSGKHALVTGATGPLQRSVVLALAEAGCDVSVTTVTDQLDEEVQANSILNECWSIGRQGEALTINLTDEAAIEEAIISLEERIAPVDILVNMPHQVPIVPFLKTDAAAESQAFSINVAAVMIPTRIIGHRMVQRGVGRVVNLASIIHDRGVPNCSLYAATQGAIVGFTKSLGIEWIRSGVTVNALALGFYEELAGPQSDSRLRAALEQYIPLRRLGRSDDIQGALIYLVSDEAAFVTSELLVVDGAISVHA